MDWVRNFYSRTGTWWHGAEARITEQDDRRLRQLRDHAGAGPHRLLELGSGYGTTAVAAARAGHTVTAVEIGDRADQGAHLGADLPEGALTVVKDDFFSVALAGRFDVVGYWNGFGVGTDGDQRRLLRRIADDWLRPGGTALVDVFNPFVWARWHGDEEHRTADPARGYPYELFERTTFDPVTCTATDTWWEAGRPDDAISQVLRCYTPADLALLLDGTGLRLHEVEATDLLRESWEYLAVLRHDG